MTFTVLIVKIEQNEEFQESRVHYTLAGIKSLLKIGERGLLDARGGVPEPLEPFPSYAPVLVGLSDKIVSICTPAISKLYIISKFSPSSAEKQGNVFKR